MPVVMNPQSEIRNPKFPFVACPNPEAEAAFAAREILKFVRAGGPFPRLRRARPQSGQLSPAARADVSAATEFRFFSTAAKPWRITRSPN